MAASAVSAACAPVRSRSVSAKDNAGTSDAAILPKIASFETEAYTTDSTLGGPALIDVALPRAATDMAAALEEVPLTLLLL